MRFFRLLIALPILVGSMYIGTIAYADDFDENCHNIAIILTEMEDLLSYLVELDTVALGREDQQMIIEMCDKLLAISGWVQRYCRRHSNDWGLELAVSLRNAANEIPANMRSGDLDEFMSSLASAVFILYDLLHWCNQTEYEKYEAENPRD